ncbi:MAG: dihydroorotase [Pseudomonadota bacterium]
MRELILRGGRVTDPAQGIVGAEMDVRIQGGRIASLEPAGGPTGQAAVIDVSGCHVVPGLIDIHTHLREPGFEYKETIASGAAAAVAGGYTAVCCMANTNPVNDNRSVTELIMRQAEAAALARIYPVAAVSKGLRGQELAEYGDLKDAGVVALSDDGHPVMDSRLMRRAMEYAAGFGLKIIDHAEDLGLSAGGAMNEGLVSTRLGLPGVFSAAEEIQVARDVALAGMLGLPVHVAHVSTAGSVRIIAEAKARGVPITAETAPHYFTLTEDALLGYDTNLKVNPPLRTAADRAAIRLALADGTIDCIATDHAPHGSIEKDVEFEQAASGTIGLETALPLCLGLVEEGVLSLERIIDLLSAAPARVLGLPGGSLRVGSGADVTIVDPDADWVAERAAFRSRGVNSAFLGRRLRGRCVATLVGGRVVFSLKALPPGLCD